MQSRQRSLHLYRYIIMHGCVHLIILIIIVIIEQKKQMKTKNFNVIQYVLLHLYGLCVYVYSYSLLLLLRLLHRTAAQMKKKIASANFQSVWYRSVRKSKSTLTHCHISLLYDVCVCVCRIRSYSLAWSASRHSTHDVAREPSINRYKTACVPTA